MPDYTSLSFPEPPADRPYVIVNMVSSVDGRTSIDGSDAGFGSPRDQRLMGELRAHADAVLVGGATLAATGATPRLRSPAQEEWRIAQGKPPTPLGAVLSRSGRLPLELPFFTAADLRTTIYLAADSPPAARAAIERTGRRLVLVPPDSPAPALLHDLRSSLGVRLLLLEGGPRLNRIFAEADAIDEWFLTLAPFLAGGDGEAIVARESGARRRALALVSCEREESTGEIFLRYRRAREGTGP